ncbi:hypothetical protein ACWN8P_05930 [Vagococcus salmoninarum]|uniref:Uncharacterized protein n=1 Tax=Vagococcus salmoninarum TaxID=2739 RepID=A0A429ZQ70_9ENTE|nr:hypothetical protein [Vagococcus salmoninarum]RST95779.1 hypothetical protein CBF35_07375 [Vagococcus salmoninarum]
MKLPRLMSADFESSLNLLDDNFVQYMNKDVNSLPDPAGRKKVQVQIFGLLLVVLLIGINYLISYLTTKGSKGELGESPFPKPPINFLPVWLFFVLLIIWILLVLIFRDRGELYLSRYRGQLNLNYYIIWLVIETNLFFLTFSYVSLTIFGTLALVFMVVFIGYAIVRSKLKSLNELLFVINFKNNKIDNFIQHSLNFIMKYGWVAVIIIMIWKVLFPNTAGGRTDIVGFIGIITMWFLMNIAVIVVESYLILPYLLYGYYQYKYPEEYREWEGKTQLEWYGEKYFNKHIKGTEKEEKIND